MRQKEGKTELPVKTAVKPGKKGRPLFSDHGPLYVGSILGSQRI